LGIIWLLMLLGRSNIYIRSANISNFFLWRDKSTIDLCSIGLKTIFRTNTSFLGCLWMHVITWFLNLNGWRWNMMKSNCWLILMLRTMILLYGLYAAFREILIYTRSTSYSNGLIIHADLGCQSPFLSRRCKWTPMTLV
jgi:hypothetical protein